MHQDNLNLLISKWIILKHNLQSFRLNILCNIRCVNQIINIQVIIFRNFRSLRHMIQLFFILFIAEKLSDRM